jgi:hypothetical protein
MSNGDEGKKKLTREEVEAILKENAELKEKLARKSGGGGNNWARTKERIATDPEFALKVQATRKAAQEKKKSKMISDPEFAAKVKAAQASRRAKQVAELKEFREFKASQKQ